MADRHERADARVEGNATGDGDQSVHDEHPTEPAEGARRPGEAAAIDTREHPVEPAEGRVDAGEG